MQEYKYIIVEIDGVPVPVIFGAALSHKAVFRGVQQGLREQVRDKGHGSWHVDPVSMGFVEHLVVGNVSGYSESVRYGFDAIPKELWHLTEAHPETDLTIINGNRTMAGVEEIIANKRIDKAAHNEAYVEKILRKQAPEARHKSPPHRWDAAIKYLTDQGISHAEASSTVARIATSKCPGAYKIP